jgi:epoxyqueuosine reductase
MLSAEHIKAAAAEAGFDLCGITRARHLDERERTFRRWLGEGRHSTLSYMERNTEKRFDASLLVEGARTVIVCGVGYKSALSEGYPAECRTKIASYAACDDYHIVIKDMLRDLSGRLRRRYPDLSGRAFVDTAPLSEKSYAVEAGLGWVGRQSLLVTPGFGSFVLLGELVVTDEADSYDAPFGGEGCGGCRACVEACPGRAILDNRTIDTSRCISCHTVEREAECGIDLDGWIFGCDACQSCCPYNRRAPLHANPRFDMRFDPRSMTAGQWRAMSEEEFVGRFGRTPLMRSGRRRIVSNIG